MTLRRRFSFHFAEVHPPPGYQQDIRNERTARLRTQSGVVLGSTYSLINFFWKYINYDNVKQAFVTNRS